MPELDHTPKYIELTRGQAAIVCTHDYERLTVHNWYANHDSGNWYAIRNNGPSMHRTVMDAPKGLVVDHIHHRTLDNRCTELRIVTQAINTRNRKGMRAANTSGVTGVFWHKPSGKWGVTIGAADRLGYFTDKHEAIAIRRKAEIELGYYIQ